MKELFEEFKNVPVRPQLKPAVGDRLKADAGGRPQPLAPGERPKPVTSSLVTLKPTAQQAKLPKAFGGTLAEGMSTEGGARAVPHDTISDETDETEMMSPLEECIVMGEIINRPRFRR